MANLPADLPENWTQGQIISPNGTEVGLDEKHGYNYLMKQVNDTQKTLNETLGGEGGGVAQETSVQQIISKMAQETSVQDVLSRLGLTGDTGGTATAGTAMAKLNRLLSWFDIGVTAKAVKSVQYQSYFGKSGGGQESEHTFTISEINPEKTVVIANGNGYVGSSGFSNVVVLSVEKTKVTVQANQNGTQGGQNYAVSIQVLELY